MRDHAALPYADPMRHGISRNNRFLVAIAGMTALAIIFVGVAYVFTESGRLDIQNDSRRTGSLADHGSDSNDDDRLLSQDRPCVKGCH